MAQWQYFKYKDFDCSETGTNEMSNEFITSLNELRRRCGFPFIITSGYRSPDHSIEKKKEKPGQHSLGVAADIKVNNGVQKYKIVAEAINMKFTGIGIAKDFIHVDRRVLENNASPVIWSY